MFKVGDKVKVKQGLILGHKYNELYYVPCMTKHENHICTVTKVIHCHFGNAYELDKDKVSAFFTDAMLEYVYSYNELIEFLERYR